MKRYLLIFMITFLASITGCATTEDLLIVQGKLDSLAKALKEENQDISKDVEKSNKDVEKVNEAISDLRERLADLDSSITEIQENMQDLRGKNEVTEKKVSTLETQSPHKDDEYRDIKKNLDQLSSRLDYIENLLEIGKNKNQPQSTEKGVTVASKNAVTEKTEKELAYESAYENFKEEKYEKSRIEFQNFLKQYPNVEYSDHAQYWIGECYYFEKKYEQAILEYDKVIKNYPQGNKVPRALLKQGFSFLNLGDKTSAELILKRVIKDYPSSSEARIAQAKLSEIK